MYAYCYYIACILQCALRKLSLLTAKVHQSDAGPFVGSLSLLGPKAVADLLASRRKLCAQASELWFDLHSVKLNLREMVSGIFYVSSATAVPNHYLNSGLPRFGFAYQEVVIRRHLSSRTYCSQIGGLKKHLSVWLLGIIDSSSLQA